MSCPALKESVRLRLARRAARESRGLIFIDMAYTSYAKQVELSRQSAETALVDCLKPYPETACVAAPGILR